MVKKKVYLAIPYTGMMESSFEQANEATAIMLTEEEVNVYSPIGHSHLIAKNFDLPTEWEFWKEIDYQFIDWADEIWVCIPKESEYLELVEKSTGVIAEIGYAATQGKPIKFFRVEDNMIKFDNQKG